MYKTISKSEFRDEFHHCGRGNQFSYEGLGALYDYLEELENYELDVIALCCEFTEYESLEEAVSNYDGLCVDTLKDYTSVIEFDGGVIIQDF